MGRFRRTFGNAAVTYTAAASPVAAVAAPPTSAAWHAYGSPLTRTDLDPAAAVAFGLSPDLDSITRREAMRVPAVRRGRAIICGTIGAMTWQARRGHDVVRRSLVDHPDPNTTPQFIYTWTLDDLLFNGIAWWYVTAFDADGYPANAERVAKDRVQIVVDDRPTPRGELPRMRVLLDGHPVDDGRMIRFDGPDEGVLTYGATTVKTCLALEQAARRYAKLDVPLGYLTPAEGAQELSTVAGSAGIVNDDRSEVDVLLDSWEDARSKRTTAFLNRALTYQTTMFDATKVQLAEARQYQSAEVARLLNLPPRYVNAPQASGMTYATTEGDRRDLVDTTLGQYIAAVEQRLSMPDVTPRGQRVAADLGKYLRGDTKAVLEAGEIAVKIGAMTGPEVRTDWLGMAASTASPAAPPALRAVPNPVGDTAP